MSGPWGKLRRAAAVLRAIIGAPDYERYLAHMRSCHPGSGVLPPAEFFALRHKERLERPGGRCC